MFIHSETGLGVKQAGRDAGFSGARLLGGYNSFCRTDVRKNMELRKDRGCKDLRRRWLEGERDLSFQRRFMLGHRCAGRKGVR